MSVLRDSIQGVQRTGMPCLLGRGAVLAAVPLPFNLFYIMHSCIPALVVPSDLVC